MKCIKPLDWVIPESFLARSVVTTLIWFAACGGIWADDAALQLHPRAEQLPFNHQGPFVHLGEGDGILAIDSSHSLVTHDNGKTWQQRPLFSEEQKEQHDIKVSDERALLRTREGTIVAAFMNSNEAHWTWKNDLHDAPGARLPTYAMRSLDGGVTWQDIQKLHDDWTGAVRDMIQTQSGRIIFTSMRMLHSPGRHSVVTYSSSDGGATWKSSNVIDLGGIGHHGGATEGTLVEKADGSVWMLIRTNLMEFWSARSTDDGQNWRILEPSGIAASSAPAIISRLSSGQLVLLWNRPLPEGKTEYPLRGGDGIWSETPVSNHRAELSMAFSSDDGQTWSTPTVIARSAGPSVAYPYLFERSPGELWVTTMQGGLRMRLSVKDFVGN